jgi:hypothetical protein
MGRYFPELTIGGRHMHLEEKAFAIESILTADVGDLLKFRAQSERPQSIASAAGEEVILWVGAEERFHGRVERIETSFGPGGRSAGFLARSEWLERAERLPLEEEYREVTEAEVAARIADALGLEGRIEEAGQVRELLIRRGDPIEFLCRLAGATGRFVAVAAGCLHFASKLPAARLHEIGPEHRLVSFQAISSADGLSGSITIDGDPGIRPLDRFLLPDALGADLPGRPQLSGTPSGALRATRVRLVIGGGGIVTEVTFASEGAWNQPPTPSLDLAIPRDSQTVPGITLCEAKG